MRANNFKRLSLSRRIAHQSLAITLLSVPVAAWADTAAGNASSQTSAIAAGSQTDSVPLETIVVNGAKSKKVAVPGSTPLSVVQPTSIISADYIAKNLAPSGNYDEAIKFSPSVFDTAPNGPGLAESQNISIRGFQDGQFNVTFDGIPWGDANDFTHHTTSYFMAHDLGQVTVDRGPGTGATIGDATFGGTVYALSKAPDENFGIDPYVSYGSFNTINAGIELDTGAMNKSGTRAMIDGEILSSDGYLTHEGQQRQNLFGKLIQPIGTQFTLTIAGMVNHIHQNISVGQTINEISTLGANWGLSNNRNSQDFYGYNLDNINADFEYGDLAGSFGNGWTMDSKIYSYGYFHDGLNGEDPNTANPNGQYPNVVMLTPGGALSAGVPGQQLTMDYRSVGTITRLTKTLPFGDVETGLWYDHQTNKRRLAEVDMTDGLAMNYDDGDTGAVGGIDRQLTQTLQTLQPYAQMNITPIQGLTLTPGLRYSWFDRNVDAAVNIKTGTPQSYDNTFHALLPSIEAHYQFNPHWAAYAQVAKGFLAPNENYFNRADPNSTSFQPETTWNYQAGTVWHTGRLSLSLDAYMINFSNMIAAIGMQGGLPIYGSLGGVHYRGFEAEGTFALAGGFSLYGNGSINSAKAVTDGSWVPNTPKATAAGGLIYSRNGIYGSLLAKWVGPRYGDTPDIQYLAAYATADASVSFDLDRFAPSLKGATFKVNINNITDNRTIINLAGYTLLSSTPLYWANPGRSVFATLEVKIH